MSTTLLLAACDSGGSGMDDGGGSVNASAQTEVLSEQRGIPVPDATVDFQAGSNEGTDATGQDGIAQFSYDVPESDTPNNVSISGNSPDIQEFSQTETWQPEVRTESITREQRRSATANLTTTTGSRPVNASYTVLDNKGDGDGGDLTLADGTTGSDGSTTINFDYLSLTDSVHVKASRSASQPSIAAKTTTIDDLEPAVVRDTIRSSPAKPTTPSERPDRVKRLKQEEDRTTPRENRSEREAITDPTGQPRTPVEVNLQRKKQGITTEYADQQSSTSIDTTVAINNLDDLTLAFDDQRPDQRTVTLQGSLNDADTEQGYNGGSITITNLDDLTEQSALTNAQGDFETTFNDVTNTFNAKITTDVNEYKQATDTVTVTPPVNNADTTITAPTLTIQRDTYDAAITAQGSNGDKVTGADGKLSGDGTSLASFTTGQDGTATQDVTTTADSLTAIINKAGWRQGTTSKALLSNRDITLNANLDLIEYTVNAEAQNESGNPVDVNVTVDDQDGNTLTRSTGSDGQTTFEGLNVTDGFQENESIIVTYNNDEYNAKQDTVTLNPDNTTTSSTVTLTPSETTVNYTVEGDATSSDGDTPADPQIHLVSPNDDTVATTTPDNTGFYAMNTTQEELNGGNQAGLASNPPGYESFSKDITLSEGTNTEDITLQEILRDYTFDVNQDNGDALSDATVDIDEANGNQYRDVTELTTGSNGEATTTISVDEDVVGGDNLRITIDKAEYNPLEFTHPVNEETKTFTSSLTRQTNAVSATINGATTQETLTLPNADVTIRNADADTTVGSTTSNNSGDYSFTTSYSDDQAYTAQIIANKGDHQADTTSIQLQNNDNTYTADVDLERLIYDLTVSAEDATTGSAVNADGSVAANGATLANYTTGTNGQTTVQINTAANNVSSEANTTNYDPSTESTTLGGSEDITVTNTLPPIQYTNNGQVTDDNGNPVSNALVTVDDRDGNKVTTKTANDGGYSLTFDVNDGVTENETIDIAADKSGFTNTTKTRTADPSNRTQTTDFTITEQANTVTATFDGDTDQEGQTLANADITIRNADADTLVTSTTSDNTGFYETSTSYPDDQAYTAQIIAKKGDHQADTTSVDLGTTDNTYTSDFNLERLIYDITINTDDANTNNAVNASGDILNNGTSLASYTTGSNGQTTIQINTAANNVSSEANTENYDTNTQGISLGASEDITVTNTLPPIQYTWEGDVTGPDTYTVKLTDSDGNQTSVTTSNPFGITGDINNADLEENETGTLRVNAAGWEQKTVQITADPSNRTKTKNLTLTEKPTSVNATINGSTKQEGQTLANANLTFINADADTTVGTTTSDSSGDYTFSTSYTDDQAYTLNIKANTGDHADKAKTVNLGTNDQTITQDFDLERLIYDITINTDDANTNNAVNASGNITANGATLANYTTGTNGQTTVQINTAANNVSSEANTTNYDPSTESTTLGGSEDITVTNTLPPIEYVFTGNVDGDNGDLSGADVSIEDQDGNQLSTTTNQAGDYNLTGTVNDGLAENETISITANDTDFGASTKQTTADPSDRDKTTNFTLTPTTVNYTVEGNVTSSDGDTVTNATININEPNGPTVASDNTGTNGFYSASTTQGELDGDKADIQTNVAGYDAYTETKTLNEGTNTQDITLQEILRDYQFNTEDTNGNTLSDATIDIDENEGGQYRDVTTLTTDASGNASTTLSVDEQIINGDELRFTANKNEYDNAETTDIVDTETETITLALNEQTTTYNISGTLTDEDGDQLTNKDILIQTTGDNTVATTTTTSDGSYSVSVTHDELGGDTGEVETNPTGYNKVETTKTFNEGSNTVDLSLPLTEYTRTFNVDDAKGNALANASIDADETTNGNRDVFTASTNTSGEHTEVLTIDDMVVDGDQLEYQFNKDGYNAAMKTETLTDTTKTINADLDQQSTTDRITITFNPKTVGNSLYTGGYSGELDYTVSTDDTTFTTTGSTTADVPISDGDQLEISQSDSEYISTFMVNNTDTEQPPMQVTPFPAEPDYQSTSTVSIDKSNVVNEYQVTGIPDTSPEGYNTIDDWKPHLDDSDVRRWTDSGGYSSLKTYIQEGHSTTWENKADTVVPEVQGFMPISIDGPTKITDSDLQDVYDNRNENNLTRIDLDADGALHNYSGGFLKNSAGFFGEGTGYGTVRSEIYSAFTGLDETENHFIKSKILDTDNNDEFIPSEAQFPIQIIYSTESPTNIQ